MRAKGAGPLRRLLVAGYYVAQPVLKPVLRTTVGRNTHIWRKLQSARDKLVTGSTPPAGLDAPLHRRLYATLFFVAGPPVRLVLKYTAGRNRRLWRVIQRGHIRLLKGVPPVAWTPDSAAPAWRAGVRHLPFGVNLSGYFTSEKGTAEAARSAAGMLSSAGIPLVLNNVIDENSANREPPPGPLAENNPYAFNLIWVNADQAANFAFHKGQSYFEGRYNIGAWAWELLEFPRDWLPRFNYFDEIWVPSRFVVDSLARASPVRVTHMPHAIGRITAPSMRDMRSRFETNESDFLFLFMFDYHSVLERKNPLGLIDAFKRAFAPGEPSTLLIKTSHSNRKVLQLLRKTAAGARVVVTDTVLRRDEVYSLYHASDCYVSLHRSEGFGLTPAEAMAAAKPVIATAYGGNMDFMNESNSYLVKHKLVELDRDYPPYEQGSFWAEPDISHAAELMRFVYENQDEAREVGKRAQVSIERTLSPFIVGQTMKARLLAIAHELGLPVDAPAGTAGATVPSAGRVTRAYTE